MHACTQENSQCYVIIEGDKNFINARSKIFDARVIFFKPDKIPLLLLCIYGC